MIESQEILTWARDYLSDRRYIIQEKSQTIRVWPWSVVTCLPTKKGYIYLKSMAKPFSIEPALLRFLFGRVSPHITKVIAANNQLSCFLIENADDTLINTLESDFKPDLLRNVLKTCTDIQISSIDHVDKLIGAGIND